MSHLPLTQAALPRTIESVTGETLECEYGFDPMLVLGLGGDATHGVCIGGDDPHEDEDTALEIAQELAAEAAEALVGKTIVSFAFEEDTDDEWPRLHLLFLDGTSHAFQLPLDAAY